MGFRNDDLLSFKLHLNNPSKIAELQELEHWDKKFSVASNATEGFFSRRWVAENLFGLSDEEFVRMQREMFYDRKFSSSLEKVGEEDAPSGGGESISDIAAQANADAEKGEAGDVAAGDESPGAEGVIKLKTFSWLSPSKKR